MLTDYERVVLRLKQYIAGKSHHGQRDLLAEIARLEVESAVEEGVPERALRLYGVALSSDLIRPSSGDPRVDASDGHNGHPQGVGAITREENHHGEQHRHAAGVH